MGRTSLPERHRLKAKLPVGHEGLWSIIRKLDDEGPWAIPDVEGETNRSRNVSGNYVRALAKAGFAKEVGERRTKYGRPIKLYRLTNKPTAHPRVRYDGAASERAGLHQEQLWTAARRSKQFSVRELAFAASTDGPVPVRTAQWYLQHLCDAGFVIVINTNGPQHEYTYRIKVAAESKPKAPRILRLHVVYDPNSDEIIVNPANAAEASS